MVVDSLDLVLHQGEVPRSRRKVSLRKVPVCFLFRKLVGPLPFGDVRRIDALAPDKLSVINDLSLILDDQFLGCCRR